MRSVYMGFLGALAFVGASHAETFTAEALSGSAIRRDVSYGAEHRYEVLQLNPDQTLTGRWMTRRSAADSTAWLSGSIRGRWRAQGDRICLSGQGLVQQGEACMRMTKVGDSPQEYRAVQDPTGEVWQIFLYQRPATETAKQR